MTRTTLVGTALAVLAAGAVLAGCGSNNDGGHDMGAMGGSSSAAPTSQQGDHNQADVTFAQQMIPHHAQALDMAKLVDSRTTNPKVVDLAGRIQKAQDPEIQRMTGWLTAWGATASMTGMSMPGMDHSTGAGMMSADEMRQLTAAKGADFDRQWLSLMVKHHQGAVAMANTELSGGANADAKKLAQQIIDGQQAEIKEMQTLLSQG
ncbi:DUF305 domain-containing protein [Solihabitans fulvus]|uniref:DUF305 domain-containing protein n=1 Tax=Solihabitans fulvus TaxID=1892852 RepID=A0A5B2XEJ5_9PSEU|nr:DUF305 domain-containing protein [Solihabitans fulvus]KAA2261574.1 DUF305 domain-containing protein [Solihabitans fulvus]